jgi:hypothetical protein
VWVNVQKLLAWHDLILIVSASGVLLLELTDAATTVSVLKVYDVGPVATLTLRVAGLEGMVQRALLQSQAAAVTVTVMVSTFAETIL